MRTVRIFYCWNKMGGACNTQGKDERVGTKIESWHVQDLSIDGMLERILNMSELLDGFHLAQVGGEGGRVNGGLLWRRWWAFRLHGWLCSHLTHWDWRTVPHVARLSSRLSLTKCISLRHVSRWGFGECELSRQCVSYLEQQQVRCQSRADCDSKLRPHSACRITAGDPSQNILTF